MVFGLQQQTPINLQEAIWHLKQWIQKNQPQLQSLKARTHQQQTLLLKLLLLNPKAVHSRTASSEKKPKVSNVSYPKQPKIGDLMGELYIPKLNAKLPIYHGTNEDELEKGVGHFAGSVLPGQNDNSVLSGHRDTVFRKLGDVGEGDSLVVSTAAGTFTYKVNKVRIVDADDRTVIVPKPRATLTVSTCYPFNYVGSAPERYILVAHLVASTK